VEALEGRSLPTVLAPVSVAPGVVQFSTTGTGNNTLNIFDDGAGNLSFSTSATGKPTVVKGGPVHEIIYNAGPGSDTFNYSMLKGASLTEHMELLVHLPPNGNKGFTATFGTPNKPRVPGSAGTPGVPAVGAKGVNIARTGRLDIRILGSHFKDNATLNYAGVVRGDLRTTYRDAQGGRGPIAQGKDGDKVTIKLDLIRGSTGTVHPRILGGVGNDNLSLVVKKHRPTDSVQIFAEGALNGGGGINKGASSFPPTTEINIQT
jgi:hypothetical protein